MTDDLDPHDADDFPAFTRALLAFMRQGPRRKPDPRVVQLIDESMPADLRALLHTFASARGIAQIGEWRLDAKGLPAAVGLDPYFTDRIEGLDDELDPARTLTIGNGRTSLVATWSPRWPQAYLYELDPEYGTFKSQGTFDSLVEDTIANFRFAQGDGARLPDDVREIQRLAEEEL